MKRRTFLKALVGLFVAPLAAKATAPTKAKISYGGVDLRGTSVVVSEVVELGQYDRVHVATIPRPGDPYGFYEIDLVDGRTVWRFTPAVPRV